MSPQATERERICDCQDFLSDYKDERAVEILVHGEQCWTKTDTAASSMWVAAQ